MAIKHTTHRSLTILPMMELKNFAYTSWRGATYHQHKVHQLLNSPGLQTMWQEDKGLDTKNQQRMQDQINVFHWHIRAFFWELDAAFDTMLVWCNQKYQLNIAEKNVTWKEVSTRSSAQADWLQKLAILQTAYDSEWFYEVRQYRNFAHRAYLFGHSEFDHHYDQSPPTFVGFRLSPAREGQMLIELEGQLSNYVKEMRDVLDAVFA